MVKYITVEVTCELCLEKIDTPAEANMDAFRVGLDAHNKCLSIADRFIKIYEKLTGLNLGVSYGS